MIGSFKSSLSNTTSRFVLFVFCLTFAALSLSAIPTHKALAADTVSTAVYQDTDDDGYIDNIRWTMDENVTACPFETGNWAVAAAGTVSINAITGLTCTGSDAILDITVTSSAATPTTGGAVNPTLTYAYVAGSHVTLTSGNMGGHAAQAATDDAAPVLLTLAKSIDTFHNILTFGYSENMAVTNGASSTTAGDITTAGTVAGFGSFATTGNVTVPTTLNTVGGNGTASITLILADYARSGYMNTSSSVEPSGVFTPVASAGTEVVESAAGGKKVNASSTVVVTTTGDSTWDLVKPSITSITLRDLVGNNGRIDQAVVVFDEAFATTLFNNCQLGGVAKNGTSYANGTTYYFNALTDTLAVDTSISNIKFTCSHFSDLAGNLLNATTPGVFVDADNTGLLVDGANPIMVSATINKTASRNTATFVYSEIVTVTDGASTATSGDLTAAGVFAGFTASFGTAGDVTVPTTLNTIAGSGTATITITLADQTAGYINNTSATGPSGVVTPVAAAAVVDAATLQVNALATPTATVTSAWTLTQPTITSATLSDADYDGRVDTATVVFSAEVRDANITDANGGLGAGAGTFATGTANDATTVFSLTSDVLAFDTSATAAEFTYSGATTLITDLFGNLLNTTTDGTIVAADVVEADNAPPVIVTTSPASGATGAALSGDIVITFSEPMTGPGTSCTFSSSPDPGGWDDITSAANWSGGDTIVTLSHESYNRSANVTITVGGCTAASGGTALQTNAAIPNPWTFITVTGGSPAGGTYTPPAAVVTLSLPNGGEILTANQQVGIGWSSANGAYVKFRVSYSADNGNNWTMLTDTVPGNATSYTWTIPTASTTQGKIKVEGLDYNGAVLASDISESVFTVLGTTVAPPPVDEPVVTPAPAVDSTVSGTYTKETALANTPTIAVDKALSTVASTNCTAGSLIKGSLPAVYYCGTDGKRYVFVNDKAYFSWYQDFSTVQIVSDATLASITIGGNITYRPGSKMVKIMSDPKVYAVARGGILRWVQTEAAATRLYGPTWNTMIDDVPDSFFVNYTIGDSITE